MQSIGTGLSEVYTSGCIATDTLDIDCNSTYIDCNSTYVDCNSTYIVLCVTGDCNLSRVPSVGLISRQGPYCLVATGCYNVHIEGTNSGAIHVVPEVEALGGGLELGTLEAGHIPWNSRSTGLDESVMT